MALEYWPCYDSYLQKTAKLSDQEVGRLFRALMTYHSTGEPQELAGRESVAYDFIADDIDRASDKYQKKCENMKRDKPQLTPIAPNCTQLPTVDSNCVQNKYKYKDKDKNNIDSKTILSADKPQKHKYGECANVLLSDDELEKLKNAFPDWEDKINNLSRALAQYGYKYKSHYMTILNWAKRDAEQKPSGYQKKEKPGDIHGCSGLGKAELEAIQKILREE